MHACMPKLGAMSILLAQVACPWNMLLMCMVLFVKDLACMHANATCHGLLQVSKNQ